MNCFCDPGGARVTRVSRTVGGSDRDCGYAVPYGFKRPRRRGNRRSPVTPPLVTVLRADGDPVVYLDDARRRPGDSFGLLTFSPGPHGAFEDNLAAARLDRDA